jgi:hypothetical protein
MDNTAERERTQLHHFSLIFPNFDTEEQTPRLIKTIATVGGVYPKKDRKLELRNKGIFARLESHEEILEMSKTLALLQDSREQSPYTRLTKSFAKPKR